MCKVVPFFKLFYLIFIPRPRHNTYKEIWGMNILILQASKIILKVILWKKCPEVPTNILTNVSKRYIYISILEGP